MDNVHKSPLVCSRCKKTFELESTYRRHGYYCRSRQSAPGTSRKRSCAACTKAKSRCDSKHPQCSTCVARRIPCYYSEGARQSQQISTSIGSTPESADDSGGTVITPESGFNLTAERNKYPIGLDLAGTDLQYFEKQGAPSKDLTNLSAPEVVPEEFDWIFGNGTDLGSRLFVDPTFTFSPLQAPDQQSYFLRSFAPPSIPFIPNCQHYERLERSLTPRPIGSKRGRMSAIFLPRMFEAYPAMMLRKETFPPFIHWTGSGTDGSTPESISNCMAIAQMFVNRGKDTNKFMWRMIRMEQERMWKNHLNFDNNDILASSQAIAIYIIMRMIEGAHPDNDFDQQLLLTLNALCMTLAERIGADLLKQAPSGDQQDWKEWIFYESRRRMETFMRILNMVIDVDNSITCSPLVGFQLFPLPMKKVLWEAPNAVAWRTEFIQTLKQKELFGLSTDGELKRMCLEYAGMNTTTVSWGNWFAEMDSFGTLVMMASSLL